MIAFIAMYRNTLRQLLGGRRVFGLAVISLIPTFILFMISRSSSDGLDGLVSQMFQRPYISLLMPIVAIMLAGSSLGDERRDQTLSFLVLRPVARTTIAAAKAFAAASAGAAFALVGSAGIAAVYANAGGEGQVFLPVLAGSVVVMAVYGPVFSLLGLLATRSTLIGLAFVFLWESALLYNFAGLAKLSLWRIGAEMTDALFGESFKLEAITLGVLERSVESSLTRMAIVVVGSIAITTLLLRRRDNV